MTPTIHLHIGEPKSGTTYLQAMLERNRTLLESVGLLTPGGREQIRASQDAIRRRSDGRLWQELADRLLAWPGTHALVSMETLCRAHPSSVKRAVRAFGSAEVRVIVTARDVMRSLPAQWQQSTQHRKTWTWPDYSQAVVSGDRRHPATGNFWSQHDLESIIDRWSHAVGAQNVSVVTVPQAGAAPLALWSRFSEALDLTAVDVESVEPSNESLGEVSAELMRRVNVAVEPLELTERQYNQTVRAVLAREVLGPRRRAEPKVVPPPEAGPWAQVEAQRIIQAVRRSGVRVVGDLDDLLPLESAECRDARQPTDSELVEVALDAVRGLVQALARG